MQDKVNMSVAILPMSQQFGWSASVAGLVQSSFFWGYMLSQVPAGYLANKYSGRWLLPSGVGVWSGFTAAVPLLTTTVRPHPPSADATWHALQHSSGPAVMRPPVVLTRLGCTLHGAVCIGATWEEDRV